MGRVMRQLMHGWNAFRDERREDTPSYPGGGMSSGSYRASAHSAGVGYFNDRSLLTSIYNRMAVDLSQVTFYHARLDDNGVAVAVERSSLNDRLTLDPNVDQTSQALFQDAAQTMFHRGHVAFVAVDASMDPTSTAAYEIGSLRCGRVVGWFPRHVTVELWDDTEGTGGLLRQITLPKEIVGIVENPFYDIMNSPSGTLQRLIRKLAILDSIDEAAGAGKLDLLIQLPHTVRLDQRKAEAEKRIEQINEQLKDSERGIAYIDITEKVIQLNRPIDNNLLAQIKELYQQVYTELGLSPEILNGMATADQMNMYQDRTIEAVATAIALEIKRKFISKTGRTQKQSIEVFRDPLRLIPISQLGEVADKLIRNEVVTANEFRPKIGFRPHSDPKANELRNPNMPVSDQPGGEEGSNVRQFPVRPPVEDQVATG